jgi:hypothetical protein
VLSLEELIEYRQIGGGNGSRPLEAVAQPGQVDAFGFDIRLGPYASTEVPKSIMPSFMRRTISVPLRPMVLNAVTSAVTAPPVTSGSVFSQNGFSKSLN